MSGEDYTVVHIGSATITQLDRPAPPAAAVAIVTRRQALRVLHDAGLLDDIDAAIDALPEPARTAARIDWEAATEFRRDFPLVLQLGASLGLTDAQLDDLFAAAAAIE